MTRSAENDAPRWHLDPPCGHARCKGYTACRVARSLVENDAPACAVPAKSNPRYCHLQGVRYDARPCVGACDLSDDTRVIPPEAGQS